MRDMSHVLKCWATWARSENSGVDYSSIAAGFKGLLPENSKSSISCSDDDGMIIDSCIAKLRVRRPDEYELIVFHYYLKVSKRKLAQRMKCDEKLIRIKLHMAEGFIEGCLSWLNVKLDMF